MKERSSLLLAKKAEPLFLVFLFVLLPFAGTGLAGDGHGAGGEGLSPAGWSRYSGRHDPMYELTQGRPAVPADLVPSPSRRGFDQIFQTT